MSAVAAGGPERELEATDGCAVDGLAHPQDGVVVGGDEVEVSRETPRATEPAFPQSGAALELRGSRD